MMRSILSLAVLLFSVIVSAASTTGNRLLVVADNVADADAYSKFFGELKGEATPRRYRRRNWRLTRCRTRVRDYLRDT